MAGAALARDTLFLACTRPAMKWGVPMQGAYANLFGTCLFAMAVGRGNPAFYLLFPLMHFPMAVLSDRNPLFFHEQTMWLRTRGTIIGAVLHAYGRGGASCV